MPTKRIGPARNVAPLRPPPFANVRDLRLKSPMMMAFPESRAILLAPEAAAWAVPAAASPAAVVEVPAGERMIPAVEAMDAILPAPQVARESALQSATMEGVLFERPVPQPWPGTRPLRPLEGRGSPPDPLASLRPLLEAGWQVAPAQGGQGTSPRAYQIEAAQALLAQNGLLLADDPGTGKTVAACQALAASFQRGAAREALVLCAGHGLRHWDQHLAAWAPSLLVTCVHGPSDERALDWRTPAHVYVADYEALAADIADGTLPPDRTAFDVVILDDALTLCGAEEKLLEALVLLKSKRRWALAGAPPEEAEDWLSVFGALTPGQLTRAARATAADLRQRFAPNVLRRTRVRLTAQLPHLARQEVWIDLDEPHLKAYREAEGEERRRLEGLGRSATTRDVVLAVDRLKQLLGAVPGPGSGARSRAVISLAHEIAVSGGKAVVFCGFEGGAPDLLQGALGTLGVTALLPNMTPQERANTIEVFREHPAVHLLLAEPLWMVESGPLPEVGFAVHTDPAWNPAVRVEVERRLWPETVGPVHIYECWAAETVDEGIHAFLAARGLLAGQLSAGTRPADIESSGDVEAWLDEVFGIRLAAAEPEAAAAAPPEAMAEAVAVEAAAEEPLAGPEFIAEEASLEISPEAAAPVAATDEFITTGESDVSRITKEAEAEEVKPPTPVPAETELTLADQTELRAWADQEVVEGPPAEPSQAVPVVPEAREEAFIPQVEPEAEREPAAQIAGEESAAVTGEEQAEWTQEAGAEVGPRLPAPAEPTEEVEATAAAPTEAEVPAEEPGPSKGEPVPAPEEAAVGKAAERLAPRVDAHRAELLELEPEALLRGVERWILALGFTEGERTQGPDRKGGEFTAWREAESSGALPEVELVLVRCVRSPKNVGVAAAKGLVLALAKRPECVAGYLVGTSDFTAACKKLADESAGKLVLISGPELWRSLHILGLL